MLGDLVGKSLAHFRVVEKIGEGGMGVVYKATDEKLGRAVALKVLPEPLADSGERRQRFLREARSAAAVTHANIATVYEIGEGDGRVFIAMEFIKGRSLRDLLAVRLPVPEALRIARNVALGLAAAHEGGVVHRDLKPENVMVTAKGDVKILDFGLAKLREAHSPSVLGEARTEQLITEEGRVLGTPPYMSPEQARGETVDVRSDVFSFGVILYEMLTGERPFQGRTSIGVLLAVTTKEPEPVASINAEVTPEVSNVVRRCLEKLPAARYATGEEVARALGALVSEPSTPAPSGGRSGPGATSPAAASVVTPKGTDTSKRELAWASAGKRALLGVVGVALLAATTLWWRRHAVPPRPTPRADALEGQFRMTNLPPSRTAVPAAELSYRRGMASLGRGEALAARTYLEAAITADPQLASAHLQRLLVETARCPTRLDVARPHFAAASRAKDTLTERDQELLDALEPAILDPPDLKAAASRLRALAARRPIDAQIWETVGVAENKLFHFRASADAFARAAVLDPNDAFFVLFFGWAQDVTGAERDRVLDECLRRSSTAYCRLERAIGHEVSGMCSELENDARTFSALVPESFEGPALLALALAGEGASTEALSLALANARAAMPDAARANAEITDRVGLALWAGDFAAALSGGDQELRADGPRRVSAEKWTVEALWEAGQRREAAEIAMGYVKRAAALPRIERPETDPMPRMLARAHAGGALSDADFVARRDGWIESWRSRLDVDAWNAAAPVVWALAFVFSSTPEDARAAVERLPLFGGLPPIGNRQFWTDDGPTGELLRLAGRLDDALPRLRSEAARCRYDMIRVQAHLGLGQALEATGDKPGACEAYNFVLARWGDAKPRSVTADKARERIQALGCEK